MKHPILVLRYFSVLNPADKRSWKLAKIEEDNVGST